ncbi:spore coat protein U-like protein [Sphingomonas jejuensis]|uniref:Spore coat protein U-like protein n=1 Tax=Sphingomonas jejuensis TaxID=904715 RepID=A0ABX0XNF5_9SPHN|nr:spore coat protein U domain-containing protein [Sphingomonas jejuensis]NJC34261.1 spore coat protein U-like protein [Sphingomonas jejuensis]
MRASVVVSTLLSTVLLAATPANANTQGTINLSLNVTNACVINGANTVQTNAGVLGSIAFPDQAGIFGDVDGELVGPQGALSVLCSPGLSPVLTIGAGQQDGSTRRNLRANGRDVAYRLFSDAQRTSEIAIGGVINLAPSASATSVPIFARVNSGGQVLPAGTYTDTVTVTLSW